MDLRLRVVNHPSLDHEAHRAISGSFAPISQRTQEQLLKNINVGSNVLILQVQEAAIVVNSQWVISIHAHKLLQCVSAMAVFLNVMSNELGFSFSIDVFVRVNEDGSPLDVALERRERMERIGDFVQTGVTLLIGGTIGAAIGAGIGFLLG